MTKKKMIVSKFISAVINSAKQRILTVICFGKNDARQAYECMPAGLDSSPIEGMQAIYAYTESTEYQTIIGYINTQQLAKPGERRWFATDADGTEKSKLWMHDDGSIEIGGTSGTVNTKHATQWEALNTALQAEKTAINGQLTLIQAAISSLGGTYTKVDVTVDISAAKLDNVLTE